MQDVREKLALSGLSEIMLQESAEDLKFAREVALQKLAGGNIKDLLNVVNTRNKTFKLSDYAKDQRQVVVNINNNQTTQRLEVGKINLEDMLKRIPEDKREAIRALADEFRKNSKLPQLVEMRGEKEDAKEKNT